ncbi:Vegetative incompatibility protein HET-E-1 [Ceratocystis fimbriata CBS 114723]|uniref:Vegetative incompatibility protein HET-E-1 n=1 Tax=Ceratocystis fimbriata CBS 114723 TaxID=1035309 RepID=A0A2C5WVG7_9PEZI|nr:Vegetative incompatibility protein HET-E-1 [Ceratocystis fimbriata CBS 114723]
MSRYFHRAKSRVRKAFRASIQNTSPATPPVPPAPVPVQPEPVPVLQASLDTPSPLPTNSESESLASLQEKIWSQAYDGLREKEPKLVQAFEDVVSAEIHHNELDIAPTNRFKDSESINRELKLHLIQKLVQNGIDRTKKEASLKQGIDDSLQVVNSVRGIIDSALRAAPEAAAVWATFCLGIEILSNPVTEALENRKGIEYVLCRIGWYWELAGLLLDENKSETATVALRKKLEEVIVLLFEKLIAYQMRSVCVYHRNQAATIFRDMFRVDDWASQLLSIKEAEEAVQYCTEQYNTQEIKMELRNLNNAAVTWQQSLQNISTAANGQVEYLRNIHTATQDQAKQQAYRDQDEKDKKCLLDLFVTDPQADKKDIEEKKGGLLKDSYKWILEHTEFQQFQNEAECRILWIKGDPGKGKTMLLCGIIDELEQDASVSLSYFFCQATGGNQLGKATSVLRGLIYGLARRNPQLITHVRMKYDYMGKELFNGRNAWHNLCEIATSMLNDPTLENATLVIDALDECSSERQRLLEFITRPSQAKWIVSSRNWLDIEESLNDAEHKAKIHLEVNQDLVSMAVDAYISFKVNQMAQRKKYSEDMRGAVLQHLKANAEGTFLWVALVCQELSDVKTRRRHTLKTLTSFPPGLESLYERMLEQISQSQDANLCMEILAKTLVVFQTITLEELQVLAEPLENLEREDVEEIVRSCGSFLSLHNNHVSFVHQSAKDHLLNKALDMIIPSDISHQHQTVFIRSLGLLHKRLERDIYRLRAPGCLIDQVSVPEPGPLAAIQYSSIFWIDHLHGSPAGVIAGQNDRIIAFFKERYLQWLEALSLLHSIPTGAKAMERLEIYLQEKASQDLQNIVKDARRFLLLHGGIIEAAPLQVYASALIFSPTNSLIRRQFSREEPDWIEVKPRVELDWNACLRTLEGHNGSVRSVVFSNDGQRLASGSFDKTVRIWDATSATCLQTLEGHDSRVASVMFSNDGQRLASGSFDKTVKVWDATSGMCLQTLEGHNDSVMSVAFSNNRQRLASGSADSTVKIWDATSGMCLRTLEGHDRWVASVVFSNDGQQLASGSFDKTIKIWDATSGTCLQALKGHDGCVQSVTFSNDGQRLASGSFDKTVKIWDTASGTCLQTLEGHSEWVQSAVFLNDGQRLASGSDDETVKIWDTTSGICMQTFEGHNGSVRSVVFSNDGKRLASGSDDKTVKIWDMTFGTPLQVLGGHHDRVTSVVFSNDGQRLASGSNDNAIKVWDATSGTCLQTLEGHYEWVQSVVFSNDGQHLASGSFDKTVKVWDATSGTCLQTLKGHDDSVMSVAFSNNRQRLASGSADSTAKIWDATSGTCLQTLKDHSDYVTSVVFSNDGQRLASGSFDKTIKI